MCRPAPSRRWRSVRFRARCRGRCCWRNWTRSPPGCHGSRSRSAYTEFDARLAARSIGAPVNPDGTVGESLLQRLQDARTPELQGALAIALGLCQHLPAAPALRELLGRSLAKEDVAGHVCIALALMGDTAAREPIQQLLVTSVRRPTLLSQAAMALGRLGDKSVADRLLTLLRDGDGTLARMSAIARALGHIGDRRSIRPLTALLFEPSMTELSRAFAAVGLGGVADRRRLPWNSQIGADMNYRAATETLLDRATGVLDIL
ncbi:MAG: HEAT repeat domain-containing protein [Planctomycetes bacterium]|nr:HEAT repeat domain-containing protein [Planctomycetota bacterium]